MASYSKPFSGQKSSTNRFASADHPLAEDDGLRIVLSQNLAPWLRQISRSHRGPAQKIALGGVM